MVPKPALRPRTRIVCALGLLSALAGCYSPQPYRYGGYPGVYTVPPAGTVSPGTVPHNETVLPPGTMQSAPTYAPPGAPSHGTPTPVDPGGWQQPPGTGSVGGDAPRYDPARDGRPPGGGNMVPDYDEPGEQFEERPRETFEGAVPFSHDGGAATIVPASSRREVAASATTVSRPPAAPYDFDREHYRWLRGRVDYDAQGQRWRITYNLDPDESDAFAGHLTLVDDDRFESLREGSVMVVEGRVDSQARDRLGRPCYRVDRLFGPLAAGEK